MDDGPINTLLLPFAIAGKAEHDPTTTILLLLATVLLVLLNGFFVATEFAIVKVRSTRIKELADAGNLAAKSAANAIKHLDDYLSATQLGITLASLGLGWVGEPVVADRIILPLFEMMQLDAPAWVHPTAIIVAFMLISFAHIVFGELAPKSLAIQRAERTALWVARPMAVFFWLFRPFIIILSSTANAGLRLFGIAPVSGHDLAHSEEELRMIITASGTDHGGTLDETQAELLDNVFAFGRRLARQVMTHRTEVLALDIESPLAENVQTAQEGEHTRYPVIQEDIDTVIGFVHTKDLFALYHTDPQADLRTIVREVLLAPESIRMGALLQQMQRKRQHLAVLVDEYGGTAGVVTLSDLLEELVGDLPDEFEAAEEAWLTQTTDDTWQADGRLAMADLEEALGYPLPCEEACDTVGGYAFWAFGRIPEVGDETETDDLALRILIMDGRRVSRLELRTLARPHEDEDEEDDMLRVAGGKP